MSLGWRPRRPHSVSFARAALAGAALGALLGILAATGEVVWVAWSVRGAGFRPELLLYGAVIEGGLGLAVGLLLGLVWSVWSAGRVQARARVGLVVREASPAAGPTLTRRAALRLGLALASAGGLGVLTLAWATDGRRQAAWAQAAPARLASRADGPPNILLVTLDTVRSDYLRVYGHPSIQTPNLDRLAAQGARFDLQIVQQPQTNPSHASMFTGMYPSSSGVRVHMVDTLPANLDTLATLLNGAGYATAALYSWLSFDPQYCQFQRGFQVYQNVAPGGPAALDNPIGKEVAADYRVAREYLLLPKMLNQATGVQQRIEEIAKGRADLTTDAAIAQLQAVHGQPFFLWLHYFDPHYPYQPPAELADQYDSGYSGPIDSSMATVDAIDSGALVPRGADLRRLVSLYEGELTFLDLHLGRLLAALDTLGLADTTVIAVTADHGEAFGEHTQEIVGPPFFHPHSLYNTEQRVPLLLRYPPLIRPGTVVSVPTQAIDLFPTLLELAGVPVPAQSQGRSLRGLLDGSDDGHDRAAFSALADYTFTSVTVPGWKFILNNASGHRQLFDLQADPNETHDLAGAQPDLAQRLAEQTQTWMKAVGIS